MVAYFVLVAMTQDVLFSCLILQLHYKYPRAFSLDVVSNYWPFTVHAYSDLQIALSLKALFIPFTNAAAANVMLPSSVGIKIGVE